MKLTNLTEAQYGSSLDRYPTVVKAMRIANEVKPNFSLNNLAWLLALDDSQYFSEADHSDLAHLRYDPGPGFKGNPQEMEEYLIGYMDDGEEEFENWLMSGLQSWFGVKE